MNLTGNKYSQYFNSLRARVGGAGHLVGTHVVTDELNG